MVGAPGLGKASLLPSSPRKWRWISAKFLGSRITGIADLNALLLGAGDKDIIHIDEAHEMPKPLQTALYQVVDKRTIFTNRKRSPRGIQVRDFTLLLSTTDEFCFFNPCEIG